MYRAGSRFTALGVYEGNVLGGFDVIAYRGAPVFSRHGWAADAKSRGGVVGVRVPGGFFEDIVAARFGDRVPFVYELPPIWLLVLDGVDVATYQFLDWMNYQGVAEAQENQRQDVEDFARGAYRLVNGVWELIEDVPGTVGDLLPVLKWAAIGIGGLLALNLVRSASGQQR